MSFILMVLFLLYHTYHSYYNNMFEIVFTVEFIESQNDMITIEVQHHKIPMIVKISVLINTKVKKKYLQSY